MIVLALIGLCLYVAALAARFAESSPSDPAFLSLSWRRPSLWLVQASWLCLVALAFWVLAG